VAKSHHHNTKKQTRLNTPRRRPYTPTGLSGGSLSGLLPDVRIRRTWMPVGRTSPSTRHGEMTERRADVPLSDGDSDRDVAHSRSGWLSSRSRRQRRYVSHAGRRSRFRFVPRSALTPAVAYDGDLVVSRRTLAPVSSGEPTQHSAFSWQQRTGTAVPSRQRRQHSRCEAPLRLTQSIRLRAITLSAHCRALTQLHSARLFHTAATHCRIRVRSLARSTLNCRLSQNSFASPLKHVLFT